MIKLYTSPGCLPCKSAKSALVDTDSIDSQAGTGIDFNGEVLTDINTANIGYVDNYKKFQNPTSTDAVKPLFSVSNRFSPEQMAEWFHNNYEEIAKAEGWQTQDKCKVEFKDLPESNRTTMIKVCERWINGC